MGSWPLINRELRVLSRQGQLFWIRVIGGAAGFATLAFILLQDVLVGASLGGRLFMAVNAILFYTIIFVGPLVTADCIVQEKREGTLGLLFLAPLTPRDIIISKLMVNAVRAFCLLLAAIPTMALPVVFGGILGQNLFWAFACQLTALCIALAAGLLASTLHRTFLQAAVLGEVYALLLTLVCGFFLRISALAACAIGLMCAWIFVEYCSIKLKSRWELESSNFHEPLWTRLFSDSQFGRTLFRWDTREARSANPIAWLQEYSWTARLAKWGWFLLAIASELVLVVGSVSNSHASTPQFFLAISIVLGMALSAANSFRQERLSGAMELLLVTPLSPGKIIFGRLWGIWVHFFPAFLVIALVWMRAGLLINVHPNLSYVVISSFLFLPAVGLYVSLFPWNLIVAWAVIFLAGAAAPLYAARFLYDSPEPSAIALVVTLQTLLGSVCFILLHQKMHNRTFDYL